MPSFRGGRGLFRRDAKIRLCFDLAQRPGQALAFRIDQRDGAGTGDRVYEEAVKAAAEMIVSKE